jgi:hypothetical protein
VDDYECIDSISIKGFQVAALYSIAGQGNLRCRVRKASWVLVCQGGEVCAVCEEVFILMVLEKAAQRLE